MDRKAKRGAIISMFKAGCSAVEISKKLKICRSTVHRVIFRFCELGTLEERKRTGRPPSVNTPAIRNKVKKRISRNNCVSMREMARQLNIAESSLRLVVHKSLKLRSFKFQKAHMLTEAMKQQRLQKCRKLSEMLRSEPQMIILFTDEKLFTVEQAHNRQNHRQLLPINTARSDRFKTVARSHHPASVMVWGGICATGKTPLVFLQKGLKENAKVYQQTILTEVLHPWAQQHFGHKKWALQQDWAPAHGAKSTIQLCKTFFPDFLDKDTWPSNSPDLNAMDYSVWSILEEMIPASRRKTVEMLKRSLLEAWDKISVDTLAAIVANFKTRVAACVKARGGHFEGLL